MTLSPPLDPGFVSAALWAKDYRAAVVTDRTSRPVAIALVRGNGFVAIHEEKILGPDHPRAADTGRFIERLVKFLLWQKGAERILIAGADELAAKLATTYGPSGARAFDHDLVGRQVFRAELEVRAIRFDELPEPSDPGMRLGGHLDGCRIGFDLGGSDRKAAALVDGEVVYSEEIAWDPYFQSDPDYHLEGVHDSIARAAAHLPRVDAIGGSAAGAYVDNEPRAGSLFRGVSAADFERSIRPMFRSLQQRWGGVPFQVMNDGEVTALAGSLWLKDGGVLGISMGTSQAGGYVRPDGTLTAWMNELAFTPMDFNPHAPRDEWSGDVGCGVQYFSQQAVARLAPLAGLAMPSDMPLPERLVAIQDLMRAGDRRATAIFETIGTYLGHALGWYDEFYEFRHLVLVGRVVSGPGGDVIRAQAGQVLANVFPELHERVRIATPDERARRHGQAIAAASLPILSTAPARADG